MNKNKKKALAATLAAAILITGTYAWQAFDQRITNETAGMDGNVGTRLHNDFDGQNADIYVENFASESTSIAAGTVAYTRVRLHEFMEIGDGAGYLTDDESLLAEAKDTKILKGYKNTGTVDLDDPNTWDIFLYGGTADATDSISQYITLTHGDADAANQGAKAYMPSFNKDFDDKKADIKGTLLGTTNDRYDATSYDEYVEYTVGEEKVADATYNIFSDESVTNGGVNVMEETHTAKMTETATIMSMADWIEAEKPVGNYWVFDTDGWAYWADGIVPQSATGLLVDAVNLIKLPDNDYHYGLHVVSESYTAFDWGIEGDTDPDRLGVYTEGITAAALDLLEVVVDYVQNPPYVIDSVSIPTPASSTVEYGQTLQLTATVTTSEVREGAKDVNWTVEEKVTAPEEPASASEVENPLNATVVNGLFTPIKEMEGKTYTITATSAKDETKSASVDIGVLAKVVVPGDSEVEALPTATSDAIKAISAGDDTPVTIDGVEYYVLAKDTVTEVDDDGDTVGTHEAALIWAADGVSLPAEYVENTFSGIDRAFFHNRTEAINSHWSNSYMRTAVLPAWMASASATTVSASAIKTAVVTDGYYTSAASSTYSVADGNMTSETTYDDVYLLSNSEFYTTYNLSGTDRAKGDYHYWLRSASSTTNVWGVLSSTGTINSNYTSTSYYGVRPALWVAL